MKIPWNWKIKLLFNFTIFLIKDIFLGCRVAKKEPYNKDKIKEDRYNVGKSKKTGTMSEPWI